MVHVCVFVYVYYDGERSQLALGREDYLCVCVCVRVCVLKQIQEFGKTEVKDLKENGRQLPVTEANKREYVQLACQMKMTESIKSQIKSFLEGFYEIIPKDLIAIFNEQELELLISGLPTIDIDDLKANTEYRSYQESSLQVCVCV